MVITFTADPMLGTIFGEWLSLVRSALDHAFYQLAVHETGQNPPTRSGARQFPLKSEEADFDALLTSKVRPMHGFSDTAVSAIRAMQPFNNKYGAKGDAIQWFHDLARQDRHRNAWEMGGLVVSARPEIRDGHEELITEWTNADTALLAPVASANRKFIPIKHVCVSEDAAEFLASGAMGAFVNTKLELVDWFVDTHAAGTSSNIRNDSLGDRMMFVEYFLGLVVDSFEQLCAEPRGTGAQSSRLGPGLDSA